jgi:hypothetical protein
VRWTNSERAVIKEKERREVGGEQGSKKERQRK